MAGSGEEECCVVAKHREAGLPRVRGGGRQAKKRLEEPFGKRRAGMMQQRVTATETRVQLEKLWNAGIVQDRLEIENAESLPGKSLA